MRKIEKHKVTDLHVAILIPCHNEALAIADVVRDFREHLPQADIHVFDNNSTDETISLAKAAGALIHREFRQGKGNVVNEMFRCVEADVYVMVDGDGTYDASQVRRLIKPVIYREYDMVCASRLSDFDKNAFRPLHVWGNNLILQTINFLFRQSLTDILTGYRAFSRRFVKTFPALSEGFQIETEMTLHALDRNLKIMEIPVRYGARVGNTASKLNTFSDGFKVMWTIFRIFKNYKPMSFFGCFGVLFVVGGLAAGYLPVKEFIETGLIYRIPSIVLATGMMILSAMTFSIGLILDTISHNQREVFQWHLAAISHQSYGSNEEAMDQKSHIQAVE